MKKLSLIMAVIVIALNSCTKEDHNIVQPASTENTVNKAGGLNAKVGISISPATPAAQTVVVSVTSNTNGILTLKFKIKATGSDLTLRKLPIQVSSTGAPISSIVNTLKLMRNNNIYDSKDGSEVLKISADTISHTTGIGNNIGGFLFNNLDANGNTVKKDSSVEYAIVVDVKATNGNYPTGSTLTFSFKNADLMSANFVALDQNGDLVKNNPGHRSGSAQGNTQILVLNALIVVMNSPTYSQVVDVSGNVTQVTYTIPFTVTTSNDLLYVGQTANYGSTVTGTNMFGFTMNNSTAPNTDDNGCGLTSVLSSSDAAVEGIAYRLDPGTTKHFVLTVVLSTPSVLNSNYRVFTKKVKTFTNSALTQNPMVFNLTPSSNYQTGYRFINN